MKLWIPIKPIPAPRPRVTRNGTYNDQKYTNYKKAISMVAKSKIKEPSDAPIFMKIEFFFEIPKSWSKAKREAAKWHTSRPDLDNLQKGIKDSLNGVAYIDDAQVCFMQVWKQYAQENGILIEIEEI